MPGMIVTSPTDDQLIVAGQDISFTGSAFDRGWPEPIDITQVTARVDGGPPADALLTPGRRSTQTVENFSGTLTAPTTPGPHRVVIEATNDLGRSTSRTIVVFVGEAPLTALFTGTSTLKTTHPRDGGSHVAQVSAQVRFSPDRRSVTLSLFPLREVTSPQAGVRVAIDVNLASGGAGTYDAATGHLDVSVTLGFRVVVDLWGIVLSDTTSLLPLMLTTGSQSSPSGAYTDTGSPLDASGFVVLVGDGAFVGGELNGRDASLTLVGTVDPHP